MTKSSSALERRMPGWIVLLGVMTLIGPISIDMYLPGFMLIQQNFGERGVERTLSSYLIGVGIGQLIYGPVSDRFGRKPPLYVSMLLYIAGSLGCAVAGNMTALISIRIVQALGGCAGMVIARAIVRDRCQPHEAARALSILMLVTSVGPILAPAVGGWVVALWGWRATFVLQALLGMLLWVAIHFVLTESHPPTPETRLHPVHVAREYLRLLADRHFMGYALIGAFLMAGVFCYLAAAPTILPTMYGLTPEHFGWLMGLNGLGFIIASQVNLRWLRKSSPVTVAGRAVWLPVLLGCMLLGLSLMAAPPLQAIIVVPVSLITSIGLINPNIAALALEPYGRSAGTASALFGSIQSLGITLAGWAMGAVNDGRLLPLAIMMLGLSCATVVTFYWAARNPRAARSYSA